MPPLRREAEHMASPIDPSRLRHHIEDYGPLATVITVSADGHPHVGTSMVEIEGGIVRIQVGPGTAGHLEENAAVCLTWSPPDGELYQLIVDGVADDVRPLGDVFQVEVTVVGGIRHRVAGAPTTAPTCLRLDQ
jgi:hypothetical protein